MSKCRLYAWGANSHGQLGLGYQSEQSSLPLEIDLSSIEVDPGEIKKIAGGAGHTLILDKNGRVYSCGWNNKGQTGHSNSQLIVNFQRIDKFENEIIEDICCGWDSSMALTKNGRVILWGSNCYGQLGRNDEFMNSIKPDKTIGLAQRIKGIAMGLRHSAVVTEGGKIFVTGSGSKQQLGIRDTENKGIRNLSAFTEIADISNVTQVVCGQNHTMALTKNGDIYAWGDNKHGQLGVNKKMIKKIEYPKKINTDKIGETIELRVGWTHTSSLNADGRIFSWGRNTYGQLGYRNEEEDSSWIPKWVNCAKKIRQLAVGSEHNVALTEEGTVLSWGWNEHGNCGNGSTRDVLVPERVQIINDSKAILVGSGAGHSFAIFTEES